MNREETKVTMADQTQAPSPEQLEGVKYRQFANPYVQKLWYFVLILIPVAGILYILRVHQLLKLNLYSAQYIGLFLGLVLFALFMAVPAYKRAPKDRVPWYDWILALLGLFIGLYLTFYYPKIVMQMGIVTTERFIISTMAILLIVEAIRRTLGLLLLTVVIVFLAYGFLAPYLPGVFKGAKIKPEQLFNYLYLDPSSLLSMLSIAGTVGLSFLIFGEVLLKFKGDTHFNNYALSLFGRFRGGPAKGSIVGSSLVGTITGGPVTNVMLTGSVTIPLMKKNGFTAAQAGAIESVASTGGSLMPPVMGIAAFMIAENLAIPYAEVALAALVPAILYYLCVFFQVDFISARDGLKGLSKDEVPSFVETLKKGWMLIPIIGSLIYFLFFKGVTPQSAGLYAAAIAVVFLVFQKSVRGTVWKSFVNIFIDAGRMLLDLGTVIAAAGIIVGITGITGLGFNLGYILVSVADYGLFWLLVACAVLSIILGMGMPSVAAYAMVAVLVAPALVELGVNPLAAHLFVFYFSILSNFTPPVALACFAASTIAKESPNAIGFRAMALGIVSYIVPFLFVYGPDLLIMDSGHMWTERVVSIATALIGCYFLAMAVEGYFMQHLSIVKRVLTAIIAMMLFLPVSVWELSWLINIIGFCGAILFVIYEWIMSRKSKNLLADKSLS